MQPRLKTSRKWSPSPAELVTQIRSVFRQNFQEHIGVGSIEAGGRIYPEEILIVVNYTAPGTIKGHGWEISLAYKKEKDNVLKLLHLAVDAIGALFEQSFTAESDEEFPRLWEEIAFEGRKIAIQYSTVNPKLETEADKILGAAKGEVEVAQGEWEEELSPEQIKAQLGIDPDDLDITADLNQILAEDEDDVEDDEPVAPKGKNRPSSH